MFRSRWFRAGLFLLVVVALLISGAGHVVFHGDHAHHDHADLQDTGGADCVACQLQLVDFDLCLSVPAASRRSTPLVELGPESLHAASERGRAAPRAPPLGV